MHSDLPPDIQDSPLLCDAAGEGVVAALASTLANNVQQDLDGEAILVPSGYELEDMERFQDHPRNVRETIEAYTLEGFLRYFHEYQSPSTAVFADPLAAHLLAVFDYPSPEVGGAIPEWGDHKLRYEPDRSRQLKAWMHSDGDMMSQPEFVDFIEERAEDFHDPPSARMLELAREFEARRDVTFRQASRLQSGDVQIKYEEETSAVGNVEVPERFEITVPMFKNGKRHRIEARLRYRIKQSGLRLGYQLLRVDEVREAAARRVVDAVEDATRDEVTVFYARRT